MRPGEDDDDDLTPNQAAMLALAGAAADAGDAKKAPKAKTRKCVDCPAQIPTQGGKTRCAPCYDVVLQQRTDARRKRAP